MLDDHALRQPGIIYGYGPLAPLEGELVNRNKPVSGEGIMLGALWLAAALAAAPPTGTALDANGKVLVSHPHYEDAIVSPDGKLLAVIEHVKDTSFIVIVHAADLSVVKTIDTGSHASIENLVWVGSRQLVANISHFEDRYRPSRIYPDLKTNLNPTLHLGYVDNASQISFHGRLIGTIPNDDHHVLIEYCAHVIHLKCKTQARLVDTDHITPDGGKIVADSPVDNAWFMADQTGAIRVAWAGDDKNNVILYVADNGKDWKLLNDSSVSGVKIWPQAVSRDNRSLFLEVEHKDGPNSFDRYDFATGARTQLLRDTVTSPLGMLMSLDGLEPLGVFLGAARPEARFIDPKSQDALWRASVLKAFPDETPNIVNASADGNTLVIFTKSDRDPGSYYLLDRLNHKAQFLFRSYPELDPKQQLPSEPFTMQARDGLALTGFVTRPAGHAGPAPTIVLVHGGPHDDRDGWYFDSAVQLLAQHGYAVLRVNYRGSDGFGRSFYRMGYKQWGEAMQDDVTDATKWAIGQGIADAKRICIYGANYGGYAALMGAAREPALYRCAASFAGIYDLNKLSRWGIPWESSRQSNYIEDDFGEDSKQLAEHSPVTRARAGEIKVPVLIAHQMYDNMVPIHLAEQMRDVLAKSGQAPVYLEYPEEYRGLEEDEHRIDFYSHLLDFFDANLGMSPNSATAPGHPVASP